ncbi:hypothetical protein KIH41_07150 [Litoribacter ruber]|uniref:hypothetical protein n=1 Tax=Litoribacter ruber TaxID=702568 RepID=UPI001BDB59AA|nr:hypothetical protein [Litoribacter ruber]MBT0811055.1 hypothetical protein [Litoribacter ruber]
MKFTPPKNNNCNKTAGPGPGLTKDTKFYLPLTYSLSHMGWYRKETDMVPAEAEHLQAIPAELHLQHTFKRGIKSTLVLTGRQGMFTGLRRTDFDGWLYGDVVTNDNGRIRKSLIILDFFAPDQFRLFFLQNLYPRIRTRQATTKDIITGIKHNRKQTPSTATEASQIQANTNYPSTNTIQ